ncbi:Gfo/Idh/MocA family oxidoreductase [Eubacteriales bacterium OttesenSCG-928-N13]|nr:Gfo/Idh/MocA family oxidoreductase [Eubacteriales bacterium OttesenSCG-928-N13]
MENIIKVGMLGMGNMGRAHSAQLRQLPNVQIVALCSDPIDDAVNYNQQNDTDYPVYQDFDKMLDETEMDVLYVCLPPFAHNGQLEKAAAKGIHIFEEKPIALTLERGQSMADAVQQAGVKSQVGYHMRFGGAIKRLKQLIDSGVTGKPTLFSANYECNSLHTPWWIDVNKSGGQILEQIIHLYDVALYLMGDAGSVTGFVTNLCHTDVPGYTVEDTSAVAIRFASGALGTITGSNCAIPGRWDGHFRIVFENLVADFFDHNHAKLTFTKEDNRVEELSFDTPVTFDEDEYFMAVVRGERPEITPISHGLKGLQLVMGLYDEAHGIDVGAAHGCIGRRVG